MSSNSKLRPAWLPPSCEFPLYETSSLERSGRLTFDKKEAAAAGAYGEVFPGTYIDDVGTKYRVCSKRDSFLSFIDLVATKGHQLFNDEELQTFYTRVSNDLLAAWRLLGDPRVVNYLAITTTTRKVASGTVVLPEYFIMEEEGEDLKTWLEHHPPCPENRAAFEGYVQCILEGLAALHSAGITHRDLKPGNVVICRHDASTAKIIDLGLAKTEIAVRAKAANSMTDGTLWYMPPEFMDPHSASQAVDVWAVGVMCAEWLLGEQLGSHEAARAHLNALSNGSDGMAAVWARLRKAAAQSGTPQSLLEQVAGAALASYAKGRPSSINLAATAASAMMTADAKRAAFTRWLTQVRHALRDCLGDVTDDAARSLITNFLSRNESVRDVPTQVEELTAIVKPLAYDPQRNQQLLRVARNTIQSLLEYSTSPEANPQLLRWLAHVYVTTSGRVNTLRAVDSLDRAIKIATEAGGADHVDTSALLYEKASALANMDEATYRDPAMLLFDRVIDIRTRNLGPDHLQTALAMNEKAKVFVQIGGTANLDSAIALYDRVIEIKTATLGADNPLTAGTLHLKATALVQKGGSENLDMAIALYDCVIEVNTVALGEKHSLTAGALHSKATALVQKRGSANFTAAIKLYDRVIEIKTATLGSDHLETAATLHSKANALVQKGGTANLDMAIALYDRIVEIRTAASGENHPSTAVALQEKATALVRKGGAADLAMAIALYDRVIVVIMTALGWDHLMTADALHAKATALVITGRLENLATAVALFNRVIKVKTAVLGENHPSIAVTLQEKATALMNMGAANFTAAIALYDRAIVIQTAALGANHPSTAATLRAKETASSRFSRQRQG
jgi:serine/threonine protein kinase